MGRFDFKTRTGQISGILQSTFDIDAQSFFLRVISAGGTLTSIEQIAINNLVLDMKNVGIWNSMKAIYPMVGSSAAACSQNLKSSSFTATFSSGWTFSSNGITPNGTSAFMDTTFIPSSNLTVNSTHGSIYLNTNNTPTQSDPVDFGSFNSATQAFLLVMSALNSTIINSRNLAALIVGTQTNRQGFGITSKTSATLTTLYKNGINAGNGNSGGSLPTFASYLGTLNFTGTPYPLGYINNRIAFHSLGEGLTNTQASDFYTAVQAFQTSLSRQV
jgi:hypothetical protein